MKMIHIKKPSWKKRHLCFLFFAVDFFVFCQDFPGTLGTSAEKPVDW